MKAEEGLYIGVDCGGTSLRAAAAPARAGAPAPGTAAGSFAAELVVPTGDAQERESGLAEAISEVVEGLLASRPAGQSTVLGIGVGLPFTCHEGKAWLNRNVKSLDPGRLEAELGRRWACPTALMNDVKCAALGEAWAGAARGADPFVFLNVGTGLSSAIHVGGQVYQGAHHAAGEIAYWVSDPENGRGLAEGYGPLEEEMSGVGLADAYARLSPQGEVISAEEIFRRAGEGEALASSVLERGISRLYPAIANLCTLVDPELLVIGGGVARGLVRRRDGLEAYLRRMVPFPPRLAWSSLGGRAGLVGAIRLSMSAAGA
jgi:glucokinase